MSCRQATPVRFAERMVKRAGSFYNALLLAAVFALTCGCGGEPTPPPPGAEKSAPDPDVELGDASSLPTTGEPTNSSPTEEKPSDEQPGAKTP
jgi:hypothetical protein